MAVPAESSSRKPLLSIEQLTIAFRGKPVVRELSLAIQPGEVLGLVGESGSGKSVTSLAILGLVEGAAEVRGSIRFDGEELLTLRPEAMRRYRGRSIATSEATLKDRAGKLYAHATTTCMIFPAKR